MRNKTFIIAPSYYYNYAFYYFGDISKFKDHINNLKQVYIQLIISNYE